MTRKREEDELLTNHDSTSAARELKTPHNPELAQAEADVERTRARVVESVVALRNEVVRRTDWRTWIQRRPGWFVAGAFALGFLLGHRREPALRK